LELAGAKTLARKPSVVRGILAFLVALAGRVGQTID